MDNYRTKVEILNVRNQGERNRVNDFLAERGLESDRDIEATAFVSYDGLPAATASLAGNIVKGVAVDPSLEGEGLAALAISSILAEARDRGIHQLRVFTSPKNEAIFSYLGFKRLAVSGDDAILLESDKRAFDRWAEDTKAEFDRLVPPGLSVLPGGEIGGRRYRVGSAVVNCNPFTRGHRSLIERAAIRCGRLLVFVLDTDKSSFPAEIRLRLVREGLADLKNVAVIGSGPYLISESTFPTYFLKEKSRATEIHARLDLTLFSTLIAPVLGIEARFMGTEPYCGVTSLYNTLMKEILPAHGIAAEELQRTELDGRAISASTVREELKKGNWSALEMLVPESTLKYLLSPEAEPVLERIAAGTARH
ncbi:[citrate (pro-3S)-lyase] ligase [Treponema sp.]